MAIPSKTLCAHLADRMLWMENLRKDDAEKGFCQRGLKEERENIICVRRERFYI